MKKKIFFLSNLDSFFLSHRIDIGKKMLKEGYEVHIGTEFTKYEKDFVKLGFKTHKINFYRNSFNFLKGIHSIIQIFFLLKRIKPDILHLISLKPIIFGGLISFVSPVKYLILSVTGLGSMFIDNNYFSKIRKTIFNFLFKLIFLFPNLKVILQNNDDLNYLVKNSKLKKKDVEIIRGSGINLNLFRYSKIPKGTFTILMASRIIRDKGIFEYIEAIKYLKKIKFNAKFMLIGDIDTENPSAIPNSLIKKWERKKLIKYLTHQIDIKKYIKKSSLVVLPSYREGFPKILMEAAACGRAVITTNAPGCRDAVINYITGIKVPVKNSYAIANAILNISKKRNLLKKMGKRARLHAEKNFDINDVVSKHLYIYKKFINN